MNRKRIAMHGHMWYLSLYIYAVCSYTRGNTEDFADLTGYGGHLREVAMDTLDYTRFGNDVNDEENSCGFEDQRKETC